MTHHIRLKGITCLFVAFLFVFLPGTPEGRRGLGVAFADLIEEVEDLQHRIAAFDKEIKQQERNIHAMQEEIDTALKERRVPDLRKLKQGATATGQRTKAYYEKPAEIRERWDAVEANFPFDVQLSWNPVNVLKSAVKSAWNTIKHPVYTVQNWLDFVGNIFAWCVSLFTQFFYKGHFERRHYEIEQIRSQRLINALKPVVRSLERLLAEKRRLVPADMQSALEEIRREEKKAVKKRTSGVARRKVRRPKQDSRAPAWGGMDPRSFAPQQGAGSQ